MQKQLFFFMKKLFYDNKKQMIGTLFKKKIYFKFFFVYFWRFALYSKFLTLF